MTTSILVLSANPMNTNTPRLRLDKEEREVFGELERSINRDQFQLTIKSATRLTDLHRALCGLQPANKHIVHFSGHGESNGLYLEKDDDQPQLILNEAIADLFRIFSSIVSIECVVLNACHTAPLAKLISRYIPFVVGIKGKIKDKAAIEFSKAFYTAILSNISVKESFEVGRNAIHLASLDNHEILILEEQHSLFNNGSMQDQAQENTSSSKRSKAKQEIDQVLQEIRVWQSTLEWLNENEEILINDAVAIIREKKTIHYGHSRSIGIKVEIDNLETNLRKQFDWIKDCLKDGSKSRIPKKSYATISTKISDIYCECWNQISKALQQLITINNTKELNLLDDFIKSWRNFYC